MAYKYENKINETFFVAGRDGRNVNIELLVELQQVYNKAKAFDEVIEYALSKNKDFEDRKDTARSNKEFNYFNTLQIANNAIINKCKQLEDDLDD